MRKLEDKRASIQPVKSKLKIEILDDEDIKNVTDTALKILEEVGVHFPHEKALQIYSDAGAKVYFKTRIVKPPTRLIITNMKKSPISYTLAARERPELDLRIDGKSGTYFNNGGCASIAVDFKSYQKRSSRKEDLIKMATIVD